MCDDPRHVSIYLSVYLSNPPGDGAVHSLAFLPGGFGSSELLATGGADCAIRLHETRTALGTVAMASVLSPVSVPNLLHTTSYLLWPACSAW